MDAILVPIGLKLHTHQVRQRNHPQAGREQFSAVDCGGGRLVVGADLLAGPKQMDSAPCRMSTSFVTRTASGSFVDTQAATAWPPTTACGTRASQKAAANRRKRSCTSSTAMRWSSQGLAGLKRSGSDMRGLHLASMDGERNRLLAFVDNAVVRTVNVGGFADGAFQHCSDSCKTGFAHDLSILFSLK